MLRYYARVFPEGRANAKARYEAAKLQLRENPFSGHRYEDWENVREMRILGTPFSVIYTIGENVIYVIDVRDQRGIRTVAGISRFRKDVP